MTAVDQCGETRVHDPHDSCAGLSEYDVIVRVGCPDCQAPATSPCRFGTLPPGVEEIPETAVHAGRRDLALTERGTCKLCGLLLLHDTRTGRVWHPTVITVTCPPLPDPRTDWNAYAEAINAGVVPGEPGSGNFLPGFPEEDRDEELDESIRSALIVDAITDGYDPTAGTYDQLTAADPPLLCPECRAGKHPNCDGQAWDQAADAPAPCECPEPEHTR